MNKIPQIDMAKSGRNGPVIKKNGSKAVNTDGIKINKIFLLSFFTKKFNILIYKKLIMEIKNYIIPFLFSFSFLSYYLVFIKKNKLAKYLGILDIPKLKRKIHKKSTPKTASLSLQLTLILILVSNLIANIFGDNFNIILIGSSIIFFIGFLDDKYNFSAYRKLFATFLTIFLTISFSENLIIKTIYLETFDTFFPLGNFAIFFTIISILLLMNALNLADGINGLSIGIVIFWLIFIVSKNNNFDFMLIIFLILTNLMIAFFHSYHGKHFLGDSGSLMLSALVAYLIIYSTNLAITSGNLPISAEHLFILFMLPGIDMFRLFIERILTKKDPFSADANHLHHHLIKKYSLKKSLFIYYSIMNIPIILTWHLNLNFFTITLLAVIFYISFVFYLKKNNSSYIKK